MQNIKIAIATVAIFIHISLAAQKVTAPDYFHGKVTDLSRSPIHSGELSFKISRLVNRELVVEIRNNSSRFVTFSPKNMIIIGHNGSQSILETVELRDPGRWGLPLDINLGPMAYLQFKYILNSEIEFPAKLYYMSKIIADISGR